MASSINTRPDKFEDYPSSSQLYEMLSPLATTPLLTHSLSARIQAAVPTASATAIAGHLTQLVTTIEFGAMPCVDPNYLVGTANPTDPYPVANGFSVPLRGYRIGLPAPAGNARPRVVITAGIHAREMLPPLAVVNYLSQLIVNYVVGKLTTSGVVPAIDHKGFDYMAGPDPKDRYDALFLDKDQPLRIKNRIFPGPDLKDIMEQLEIIVLPVANPTGRDFVVAQPSENTDSKKKDVRRNWRKNRRALLGVVTGADGAATKNSNSFQESVLVRPIGVDINRNANFAWKAEDYYLPQTVADTDDLQNASPTRFDDYRGPSANSELETCAILAALTAATVADMPAAQQRLNKLPLVPEADVVEPAFRGPLFYLDVHSFTGGIYTPWGTETPGTANPAMNFMNAAWAKRRDGPKVNGYLEFIPPLVTFGTGTYEYNLLEEHTVFFANKMMQAIEKAVVEPADVTPEVKTRLGEHCRYQVAYSSSPEGDLYPTPGTPNDYQIGENIRGITNLTTPDKVYHNPTRTGPSIGLTIEVGKFGDGEFAPVDAKKQGKEYTSCGSYSKVERETFAALHTFLLQSINCAKKNK